VDDPPAAPLCQGSGVEQPQKKGREMVEKYHPRLSIT
jgi:hypothetical protein